MDKREKSRMQWENEIVARQQNVTPADFPEGTRYAKIAGLPKIVRQIRFWTGIVVLALGVSVWHPSIPIMVNVAIIATGLGLAVSTLRS